MKTILGIDPGFGRMGFACLKVDGPRSRAVDFGVITTSEEDDFGDRLQQVAADLRQLLQTWKPDIVVLETLYFTSNARTAMRVAEARGVAVLVSAEQDIPIREFTPSQIKKALTGNGKADKEAVQMMTMRLLSLPSVPEPDDAADALAIALTAATMP